MTTTAAIEERLFGATLGAFDVCAVYLGEKLGLYDALAEESMTAPGLAAAVGAHPRFVREWLEQQVVSGLLDVDDPAAAADERRYTLPPAHAEALTDRDSTAYLAPLLRLAAAVSIQLPALVEAYRTGAGLGWAQYGADMRTAQADMNRPWFLHVLGSQWFTAVPDLDVRLRDGARVADVGCGEGWSSIGIAQAYPGTTVDGYDVDPASVRAAADHVEAVGLTDRVRVREADAATVADAEAGSYDVVTAFECIHDLPYPVDVLASMRRLAKPDGQVVVMDERVPDTFTGSGDDVERLMYGFSVLACLPDGMAHPGSAGTGTVMRLPVLRGYAQQAGFRDVEVLPIDNELWRFYRLLR